MQPIIHNFMQISMGCLIRMITKTDNMNEKNMSILMKVLLVVSTLSTFAGALAKMHHYPVSNYFFSCGIISFLFLYLCTLNRNRFTRMNKKLKDQKIVD